MLPKLALALVSLAISTNAGSAAEGLPGVLPAGSERSACFQRVYDAAHLRRTPRQMTTSLRVLFREEANIAGGIGRSHSIRIEMKRRNDASAHYAVGVCDYEDSVNGTVTGQPVIKSYKKQSGIGCMMMAGPDTEGGYVIADAATNAVMIYVDDSMRMFPDRTRVKSGGGAGVDFGRDDQVFRLEAAPASVCADLPEKRPGFRD